MKIKVLTIFCYLKFNYIFKLLQNGTHTSGQQNAPNIQCEARITYSCTKFICL